MSRNRYRSSNHPDSGPEPIFEGFQLIGDSQFLRFAEQLLHRKRRKENGLAYLGLCVSGQKTMDLLNRIRSGFGSVSRKVILMIGTNDLLQNTPESRMIKEIQDLVRTLMDDVQTLIIVTVPPVPRLAKNASHWKRLRIFNDRIKAFDNGNDIFVVDGYQEFIKKRTPRRNPTSSLSDTSRISNRSRNSSFSCRDSGGTNSWDYNSDISRTSNHSRNSSFSSRDSRGRWNYNSVEDDHDDTFGEEDSVSQVDGVADEINLDCFEEFFSRKTGKEDLIHLNNYGLCIIRRLVSEKIRSLRKYR